MICTQRSLLCLSTQTQTNVPGQTKTRSLMNVDASLAPPQPHRRMLNVQWFLKVNHFRLHRHDEYADKRTIRYDDNDNEKDKSEAWKVGRIANVVDVLIVLKSWIFASWRPATEKTRNASFRWSLFHLCSANYFRCEKQGTRIKFHLNRISY